MNNFELAKDYFIDGCTFLEAEDFSQAEYKFKKSLELIPDRVSTLTNLSATLLKLKKYSEAKAAAERALLIQNGNIQAYLNLGILEKELKNFESSLNYFDQVLSLKPDYAEGWSNKGAALHELKRYEEAIVHFDKALHLKPDYYEALGNKGSALNELKRYEEAIVHFDQVLSLKPDYAEGWSNKGIALNFLKRHSESASCYSKALEHKSGDSYLFGQSHHQMMLCCDWHNYEKNTLNLFRLTNEGRAGSEPFGFQGIAGSEELLRKCAEIYSNDKFPMLGNLSESKKYKHHKIRIGYLCGEFRNHATSILMTHVWELHDKSKFEIFAFDNGWDDHSDYRQRIKAAFSHIFDISRLSDMDAANLIQSNEIDILVNLNGFFGLARQGVFSYKPAPIQVNYLGFPGTIGAKYIDYIIADKVVIPEGSKKYYVEKVAYLPHSYQANDIHRIISKRRFTKSELGLPENGFVFACFNNSYKITPPTFDSWIRILTHVQGSVLWLLADNEIAKENLMAAAAARGLDPSRLIFAGRLSISEHLARHDLADLFLDTLPYNAHTTCSDALWAGLPVLTLIGSTFPGRVAASLLTSVGLGGLITYSEKEFEAMAIDLATKPKKLGLIREKLTQNRLANPLFDAPLFTNKIEAAYMEMYKRYQNDIEPDHISVT